MRVAITGATGFVGREVVKLLARQGHEPVALVRSGGDRSAEETQALIPDAIVVEYDPFDVESVGSALKGADGVVNLAGESIFGHWFMNKKRKLQGIRDSRIRTTRLIVDAMADLDPRPRVLVSASAIGFYGPREPDQTCMEDELEATVFKPSDFLAHTCRDWEERAKKARLLGVREVRLRIGMVVGESGGALSVMEGPFKLGLGGRIGSGKQMVSWIHAEDLCRLILFVLNEEEAQGALNATSPNPVSNAEFTKALGRALGRPTLLPVPPLALKLKFGPASLVMITGQCVRPTKALALGFTFRYPTIEDALNSIYLRKAKGNLPITA